MTQSHSPPTTGESMEKLDKERYLKRVIVVCWVALAICFGIKLFGGNLFEIICENENFIKVCEYADSNFLARYSIGFLYSFVSAYFFVMAVCQKRRLETWEFIVTLITVSLGTLIKIYNQNVGFVFDFWQQIIMPLIFSGTNRKRFIFVLLGNILLFVFQVISVIIKNIGTFFVTDNGVLISAIFSIDVILMVIIYYFYSNIILERRGKG